ncbi:SDR family NAD(P)-dependent oxidoreductase [Streptomyces tricolor]|uniref:SDR family NAD(P)-dependent oxidoreductase n=1 Tax=Streptomyces tricolor TaxID=68277 RepID=UPI0036EFE7D7
MPDVAVVTGASRGIGRAIAARLAKSGYDLALVARSEGPLAETAALVEGFGRRALTVAADITRRDDVERVRTTVLDAFGHVDVLVNNAGYASRPQPFAEWDPDDWWQVIETNLRGPALLCRALLPGMLARRSGYIVNINSLQGSKVSGAGSAYGVSKAGLMRLTDALADEVRGSGVTLFDLSPGLVRTEMTSGRPDLDALPESAWSPPEAAAEKLAHLLSGRYDALHGRFVHLTDDLDDLVGRLAGDARLLRMRPPADPADTTATTVTTA